jgi:hypothetical protein
MKLNSIKRALTLFSERLDLQIFNIFIMIKNTYLVYILFLLLPSIKASVFYVDASTGLDANDGSEDNPWATIQKAANTALAGDIVYIKAGVYYGRVDVAHSGTPDNYIIFSNYDEDEVFLNGEGFVWDLEWNGLFDMSNQSFIEVKGLIVENSYYGGFWADDSHHIYIHHNKTNNTVSSGIGIWNSHDVIVYSNEVVLACNDGPQECISVSNSFDCEVKYNNDHDNGPGNEGGEGIDVKEVSHDEDVHHNLVHHLNQRVGIYADAWDVSTSHINIYSNVVPTLRYKHA